MTHSPAEWAAAGFLGVDAIGLIAFALAFADADLADFDPRPAWSRLVESGRLDPLLIAVGPVLHDAREALAAARVFGRLSLRDAAVSVAALLALLLPATGGTR